MFIEWVNTITRFLDEAMSFTDGTSPYSYCHYVCWYKSDDNERHLAIRIPGSTVGEVELDENNVITKILLFGNPSLISYSDDVINKVNEKFVGLTYDFSKDEYKYDYINGKSKNKRM